MWWTNSLWWLKLFSSSSQSTMHPVYPFPFLSSTRGSNWRTFYKSRLGVSSNPSGFQTRDYEGPSQIQREHFLGVPRLNGGHLQNLLQATPSVWYLNPFSVGLLKAPESSTTVSKKKNVSLFLRVIALWKSLKGSFHTAVPVEWSLSSGKEKFDRKCFQRIQIFQTLKDIYLTFFLLLFSAIYSI